MKAATPPVPSPVGARYVLRQWWREAEWLVILAAALIAIVLGLIGWSRYLDELDRPFEPLDSLYLTIQLFTLQISGVPEGPGFPPELQVAKYLAPVVAGYAAARALLTVFSETTQQIGVRFARDHVLVIGLGDFGLTLVRRLRERGVAVVAVEADPASPAIRPALDVGARVVTGDARDVRLLGRVRVDRCRTVVVHQSGDEVSGEIAAAVTTALDGDAGRGTVVDCHLVLDHPELSAAMRTLDLSEGSPGAVDLEFVHLDELAATRLVSRFAPPDQGEVLLVGDGEFAEAVALRVAMSASTEGSLRMAVVSPDAGATVERWSRAHPGLGALVDLAALEGDPAEPATIEAMAAHRPQRVYVCDESGVGGLSPAVALAESGLDVVVRLSHESGLAELAGRSSALAGRLSAFGYVDAITDPDLLIGGMWERLARAIHDIYRAARIAEGGLPADDPSLRPWDELSDALQASNRAQARDLGTKAAELGARIVPATAATDPSTFTMTDEQVEALSRHEHDRWMVERLAAGWTLGPRNPDAKTSPDLVPYDELDEPAREKDREAVRSIPDLLRVAGYRLVG